MSAGKDGEYPGEAPITVHHDVGILAPKMRDAVSAFLAECADRGIEAKVHETYRERATAEAYYARGRTQIPPDGTVTNAPNELYSWHGYKLAIDVVHRTKGWKVPAGWFALVGEIGKRHDMKWGGDWTHPDLPHLQWHRCRATPSDDARRILREGGIEAVWRAVGAAA